MPDPARRRLLADPAPLRDSAAFRGLWLGQSLSGIGNQFAVVAISLQVYALTRSTFAVGLLGVFALVPLVTLGLYGGALVDVHDRRAVALTASAGMWLVSLVTLAQALLHLRSVGLLYVLVALQNAGYAVTSPARSAMIPQVLPSHLLPAANALQTLSMTLAGAAGPLLGALTVAAFGFAAAYAVDSVAYLASLAGLWRLPPLRADRAPALPAGPPGFASVVEGMRYLGARPNVRMTFLADLCAMVLAHPRALFPAVGAVILGGGAATVGLLSSAVAAGSVLASLLSGRLGNVRHQGRAVVRCVAVWGVGVAAFGLVALWSAVGSDAARSGAHGSRPVPDGVLLPALVLAMLALAVAGAADAVSAVYRMTILQAATPDHLRGRLQGVFIVVVAGGPRLGDLVAGTAGSWFSEGVAALAGGMACILAVLCLGRSQPRFLAYDARHPEP